MSEENTKKFINILFYFFTLFVFATTFSIALSQISLGLSLILFLIISLASKYNPFIGILKWFYIFVSLYILWLIISSLAGKTPMKSFLMIKEEWLFCAIPITIFLFDNPSYRKKIIIAFIASVFIMSAYGIFQHYTGNNFLKGESLIKGLEEGYFAEGTFPHHLTYGNFFATAAAFMLGLGFLKKKWKIISINGAAIVTTIFSMLATIFSYSRMSIASMGLSLILIGLLRNLRWSLIMVAFTIVTAWGVYNFIPGVSIGFDLAVNEHLAGNNERARVFIWKKSIQIIEENLIFGVGQGNFDKEYAATLKSGESKIRVHAHNDILNVAAIAGIPGMIFFIILWIVLLRYILLGWRKTDKFTFEHALAGAAFIASATFLSTSITEATFADEEVREMLMFIWGVGLWTFLDASRKNKIANKQTIFI